MGKTRMTKLLLLASLLVAVWIAAFAPAAYAAAPGIGTATPLPGDTSTGKPTTKQDPAWLAKKRAHMVVSGLRPNQPKGTKANPHTLLQPYSAASAPAALTLNTTYTTNVREPSDGDQPNFGCNVSTGVCGAHTDDNGNAYGYSTGYCQYGYYCDMVRLCGPGASDVALWYWPAPANGMNTYATDWAPNFAHGLPAVSTTWHGVDVDNVYRMRGYMAYLAWQTLVPGYASGMQDTDYFPSAGTTLWKIERTLNWEASGNNTSNWNGYFYIHEWWNQNTQAMFQDDVVTDISVSSVPVVAEVDASKLPNWAGAVGPINHFITIIGYDNNQHLYTYTDTCGHMTACNGASANKDTGVYTIDQTKLWNAITAVPVNTADNETGGDGGWVW
jgi:hypothetical protein